jgi:hypothetical protein
MSRELKWQLTGIPEPNEPRPILYPEKAVERGIYLWEIKTDQALGTGSFAV